MAITRGKTFTSTEQVTAAKLHQLVDDATLDAASVGASQLVNGSIVNAHVSTSAGLALSKIAATNGKLVGGGSSNTAEEVTPTAPVTVAGSSISIAASGIGNSLLADNAVAKRNMADNSVGTDEIEDQAVTKDKLDQDWIGALTLKASPATGDWVPIGDSAASNNQKYATLQSLVQAGLSKATSTTAAASATGAVINEAHGLGAVPQLVYAVIVCTDSGGDVGYAQNDEVALSMLTAIVPGNEFSQFAVGANATNFWLLRDAYAINTQNKTDGTTVAIDESKWVFKIYARL